MKFEGVLKNLELNNDSEVSYWVITSYGHVKERFETFTVIVGFKSIDSYQKGKKYNQDSSIEITFQPFDSLDILKDIESGMNPELAIWKKIVSKSNYITRDKSQVQFTDCELIFTDNELTYIKPSEYFINKNLFTSTESKTTSLNDNSLIPVGTGLNSIKENTLISIGEKVNINLFGSISTLENETVNIDFNSNNKALSTVEFNNSITNSLSIDIQLVKVKNNLIYVKTKLNCGDLVHTNEVFVEFDYTVDNLIDLTCNFITPSNSNFIKIDSMTLKLN